MSEINTKSKTWAYEDYLQLEGEDRHEIINGELYIAPAPYSIHQWVLKLIQMEIELYNIENKIGEVFPSPLDVILSDENVFQPDLVFIKKASLGNLKKRGYFGAPDIAVEILSNDSVYRDRHQKFDIYREFKVPEYWIADPANKTIEVYELKGNKYSLYSFAAENEALKSKALDDFVLDTSKIWGKIKISE